MSVMRKMVDSSKSKDGWGVECHPYPKGEASYIQTRWDLCTGCGICEIACSMFHFGVMNRELSRIRIYRYFTPLSKSVQAVCVQCRDEERECEKACPLDPPAIHYDKDLLHVNVDQDRCLGHKCGRCAEACGSSAIHFYPPTHDFAIVCDLCEREGQRRPQCVEACPAYALEFRGEKFPSYIERVPPEEKAEALSERLSPLRKDQVSSRWKEWLK